MCLAVVALAYLHLQDYIATHLCDRVCIKSSNPSSTSYACAVQILNLFKISKARSTTAGTQCFPGFKSWSLQATNPLCSTTLLIKLNYHYLTTQCKHCAIIAFRCHNCCIVMIPDPTFHARGWLARLGSNMMAVQSSFRECGPNWSLCLYRLQQTCYNICNTQSQKPNTL